MKLLVLTKSKIYTAPHSFTFDGIFVYSDDMFFGLKWAEIEKITLVGFLSGSDFDAQKLSLPATEVAALGIDAAYEAREKSMAGRLRNACAFFFVIIKNRRQLKDVDILYSAYFDYSAFMLLAVRIANPRIRIVNDVITDYPLWNYAKKHRWIEKAYLFTHQYLTYLLSDDVWFISNYLMERYPSKKGSVVFNSPVSEAIISSPKGLSNGPVKLLFVGRFASEKIPDVPLLVLKNLQEKGYDAALTMVGGGPLEDKIKDLARTLGVGSRVNFTGRIFDRKKLFKMFRECDFLIFPSLMGEALGFVALEAMSQGSVVLGTAAGGISEVIEDGKSGVLIPAEDAGRRAHVAAQLALRAIPFIEDPKMYREVSRHAVERVKKFTIEACGKVQKERFYALLRK